MLSAMDSINQNDVIILVMGVTGAGKSTFIDHLCRQHGTRSGKSLEPYTESLDPVRIYGHPTYNDRIVVVDTPGFDDTRVDDIKILQKIADFLMKLRERSILPCGIFYMHRISDNRMALADHRAFHSFRELCGYQAYRNVLFVTTMWDMIHEEHVKEMEDQLTTRVWRGMIKSGASTTSRYRNTPQSAWGALDNFLDTRSNLLPVTLQIQQELFDDRKKLEETKAAQALLGLLQRTKVAIMLLGLTGSGKSTFINSAARASKANVNNKLTSQDLSVNHICVDHPHDNITLVFIDTPGFDHYKIDDRKVLKIISDSLQSSSLSDVLFGGIIYLHDINESRAPSLQIGIMAVLSSLSVPEPVKHVLLATTKWNRPNTSKSDNCSREAELIRNTWKHITAKGALIGKFEQTDYVSAWNLVDLLLELRPLDLEAIYKDLDKIQKILPAPPKKKKGFLAKLFLKLFGM